MGVTQFPLNSHLFKFKMFPVFLLLILCCSLLPTTLSIGNSIGNSIGSSIGNSIGNSNPEPMPEPMNNGMGGGYLDGVLAGAMRGISACGRGEMMRPPYWSIRL